MNKDFIEVVSIEQLEELYSCSAMTWEGLVESDYEEAMKLCAVEGAKGYYIKGSIFNQLCKLTGSNAYPKDLNIFAIDKYKGLAMMYGARWMDDIIDNNARRQKYKPFKKLED